MKLNEFAMYLHARLTKIIIILLELHD